MLNIHTTYRLASSRKSAMDDPPKFKVSGTTTTYLVPIS